MSIFTQLKERASRLARNASTSAQQAWDMVSGANAEKAQKEMDAANRQLDRSFANVSMAGVNLAVTGGLVTGKFDQDIAVKASQGVKKALHDRLGEGWLASAAIATGNAPNPAQAEKIGEIIARAAQEGLQDKGPFQSVKDRFIALQDRIARELKAEKPYAGINDAADAIAKKATHEIAKGVLEAAARIDSTLPTWAKAAVPKAAVQHTFAMQNTSVSSLGGLSASTLGGAKSTAKER